VQFGCVRACQHLRNQRLGIEYVFIQQFERKLGSVFARFVEPLRFACCIQGTLLVAGRQS
jgi:hypothetical protein